MSTYGDDVGALARSLAELLARGSRQHASCADPAAVLAARDAVLRGVRGAYDAVLRSGLRLSTTSRALAALDPVRTLQTAMHELPAAAPDVAPSRAGDLAHDTEPDRWWRAAAAAAVAIDRYHDRLPRLPPPAAATALRDLARLADGLVELDHDLALGLAEYPDTAAARAALDRPLSHGAVRLAAAGIATITDSHPTDCGADPLRGRVTPRPMVVGTAQDLPESARRVAAMLRARGQNVALRDVTVVTATLAHGVAIGGDLLEAAATGGADRVRPVARALQELRPLLAGVSAARAGTATLTPPSGAIAAQCREMLEGLRRLPGHGGHPRQGAAGVGVDGAVPAVLAWADELPNMAVTLNRALVAAVRGRRLMIPTHRESRGRVQHLWQPASPGVPLPILERAVALENGKARLGRTLAVAWERDHLSNGWTAPAPAATTRLRRVLADRDRFGHTFTVESEPAGRDGGRS